VSEHKELRILGHKKQEAIEMAMECCNSPTELLLFKPPIVPTQVGLLERVGLDPSATQEDNGSDGCPGKSA
jgi:hypothetical protein